MPVFYTSIPASLKCILLPVAYPDWVHCYVWRTDVEFPLLRNTVTCNQTCVTISHSAIATLNSTYFKTEKGRGRRRRGKHY